MAESADKSCLGTGLFVRIWQTEITIKKHVLIQQTQDTNDVKYRRCGQCFPVFDWITGSGLK